jgi:O-antigen ligase
MLMRIGLICGPLAVALGVLPLVENTNLIMRPLLAIAILAALLRFRPRFAAPELSWIVLLGIYFIAFCLSAIGSVVPDVAWVNVGRQAFILLLALAFLVLFREPEARLAALKALAVLLVSVGGVTAWIYLKLIPAYGFGYDSLRIIKGVALTDYGVGLNTISYVAVIALLGVRMAYPLTRLGTYGLFAVGILCISVLGSRAPLLALVLAWFVVGLLRTMWRVSPLLGLVGIPLAVLTAGAGWIVVADYAVAIRETFGPEVLREISVGRTDLWQAGLAMFAERPLFGWGPESWKAVLLEFLPGSDDRLFRLLSDLESGSFHNGFITVVAERGAIGLLSALLIQVHLFWCAAQVYMRRGLFDPREGQAIAFIPLIVLFMFVRSLAESSGLFGNANSEVDYLTYFLASYVVAVHADGVRLAKAALVEAEALPADEGLSPVGTG